MNVKIPINKLLANPFRNIGTYQISRQKVDSLKASFDATGYWPIIVARECAGRRGYYEQAFAHHRSVAFREFYGDTAAIEIIVMDLDDADMLRMMAHENQDDWATSFIVNMETIQSVLKAYADGKIELEEPGGVAHHRFADEEKTKPYNAQTVSKFIAQRPGDDGGPTPSIYDGISALEFVAYGIITIPQLIGLRNYQFNAVLRQIRNVERRAWPNRQRMTHDMSDMRREVRNAQKDGNEQRIKSWQSKIRTLEQKFAEKKKAVVAIQRKVAGKIVSDLLSGEIGTTQAVRITDRIIPLRIEKMIPNQAKFTKALQKDIWSILSEAKDRKRYDRVTAVIKHRDELKPENLVTIANALKDVAVVLMNFAQQIEPSVRMKLVQEAPRMLTMEEVG